MTQNNYLCETDQFILKPNNQLRQMGQLEIKRNTIDFEINLSGNNAIYHALYRQSLHEVVIT